MTLRQARFRLARWLLGYTPMRRPEKDGAYILIVQTNDGYRAEILTPTSSLSMELTNSLPSFAEIEADPTAYRPHGPHGTFTGTIGAAS